MARPIDEKIVKLRLENQDFKTKVGETLNVFGKLKTGLGTSIDTKKLGDATSSMGKLNDVTKNFTLGNMASDLETVTGRFTNLGIIATTALVNISNKAIDAGLQMAKSFAIDPIMDGFSEYENKMNSTKVILANTLGKSDLSDVNDALAELNTYSDKTIYSFAEMTSNIGRFTSAGSGLEESVTTIKGLSNLSAMSGATAQQNATVMYQLSQAMASGTIKLQDWNSVVNANMGGKGFQESLQMVARQNGIAIDDIIKANGSFRESLTTGWLTSDILNQTMELYTDDLTEADLMAKGYTKSQAADIKRMSKAANDAATKVNTLSQLKDTVMESIASGWATTWELIIGDFETSGEIFTKIADAIGGAVGIISDSRNNFIKGFKDIGGFKNLWLGLANIFTAVHKVLELVTTAFKAVFPPMTFTTAGKFAEIFEVITSKLIISDETIANLGPVLKSFFQQLSFIKDIGVKVAKAIGGLIPDNLFGILKNVVVEFLKLVTAFGNGISPLETISEFMTKVGEKAKELGDKLEPVISMIGGGLVTGLKDLTSWAKGFEFPSLKSLKEDFGDITVLFSGIKMPPFLDNLNDSFSTFQFPLSLTRLKEFFTDFTLPTTFTKIKESFAALTIPKLDSPFANVGDLTIGDKLAVVFERIGNAATKVKDVLTGALDAIKRVISGISESYRNIKASMDNVMAEAGEKVGNIGMFEIAGIGGLAGAFIVIKKIWNLVSDVQGLVGSGKGFMEKLQDAVGGIGDALDAFTQKVKYEIIRNIAIALGVLTASLWALSFLDVEELKIGLAGLGGSLAVLLTSMGVLSKLNMTSIDTAKIMGVLVALGITVGLVAGAMAKLSKLDNDALMVSTIAVTAIFGALILALKGITVVMGTMKDGGSDMMKAVAALGAMGLVVGILTKSVVKLSVLNPTQLGAATLAVVALLGVLVGGFAALAAIPLKGLQNIEMFVKFANALAKSAVAIAIFAISLGALVVTVQRLGEIDFPVLKQGLIALAAILGAMALFEVISDGKGTIQAGIGLAILAASIHLIVPALYAMGTMPYDVIIQGIKTMAGVLISLGIALSLAKQSLTGAIGMLVVVEVLKALTPIILVYGTLPMDQVAKGLLAMGAALLVIVGAMYFAKDAIKGAASVILMAGALHILMGPLNELSEMGLGVIPMLVGLAGSLTVLYIASGLFGDNLATVMKGTVGITAMSISVMLLAPALLILSQIPFAGMMTALLGLAGVFAIMAGVAYVLSPMAVGLLALGAAVALVGAGLALAGVGFSLFSAGLIVFAGTAGAAAAGFIMSLGIIADGFTKIMPKIENAIGAGIDMVANLIIQYAPKISFAVGVLVLSLLHTLFLMLPEFTNMAVLFIVAMIQGLGNGLPMIITAAVQMIIQFVAGMKEAIRTEGPALIAEFLGLIGEVFILAIKGLAAVLDSFIGWLPGVSSALEGFASTSETVLRDAFDGSAMGSEFASGVQSSIPGAVDATGQLTSGVANEIEDLQAEKFGRNAGSSYADGLGGTAPLAGAAAFDISQLTGDGLMSFDAFGGASDMMANFGTGLGTGSASPLGEAGNIGDLLGGNLTSFDAFGGGEGLMEQFGGGLDFGGQGVIDTGFNISSLTGNALGSYDFKTKGGETAIVFGDGMDTKKKYVELKAAGLSDAAIANLGVNTPVNAGGEFAIDYADGMERENRYVIGKARGLSDDTLAQLGLFPATQEGRKKAMEFGDGLTAGETYATGKALDISDEVLKALDATSADEEGEKKAKQYGDGMSREARFAIGIASGISEDTLEAMGEYPPGEEGEKKAKALGDGMSSQDKYVIGKAKGVSHEALIAMGFHPPYDLGAKKARDLASGIVSEEGKVDSAARSVAKSAKTEIGSVSAKPSGKNFGQGYANGILGARKAVVDAAYRIGRSGVNSLRSSISEQSPSKETAKSGTNFGLGFIQAIKRMIRPVGEAAEEMGKHSLKSVNTFVDSFAESFVKDNEMEMTLRPVVDLDQLKPIPDQSLSVKPSVDQTSMNFGQVVSGLRQNGDVLNQTIRIDELRKEWETLKASSAKATSDTYNINITANGDLPQSAIKRMAQQIQIEIKNVNDRDKMSKGITVNY